MIYIIWEGLFETFVNTRMWCLKITPVFFSKTYPFDSLVQYFLNIILSEFLRTNDCARVFLAFPCNSYFRLFENRWCMPSYIFLWLLHVYKVLYDSYPTEQIPDWHFPKDRSPTDIFPTYTSSTDISPTDNSPTGHFPDRTFPRPSIKNFIVTSYYHRLHIDGLEINKISYTFNLCHVI